MLRVLIRKQHLPTIQVYCNENFLYHYGERKFPALKLFFICRIYGFHDEVIIAAIPKPKKNANNKIQYVEHISTYRQFSKQLAIVQAIEIV